VVACESKVFGGSLNTLLHLNDCIRNLLVLVVLRGFLNGSDVAMRNALLSALADKEAGVVLGQATPRNS
jgi:hypothetical protein